MSWHCSCGLVNSNSNQFCPAALTWKTITHEQVSESNLDWTTIRISLNQVTKEIEAYGKGYDPMTEEEQLFANWWTEEKVLIKDLDYIGLRERREKMVKVMQEAKARVRAMDDDIRDRDAKKKSSTKEWIKPLSSSPDVSDKINVVETRKKRMNKLEKMQNQLAGLLGDDIAKEMALNMAKKASDDKVFVFKKSDLDKADPDNIDVAKVPASNEKKVFDPSKLVFGKKNLKQEER